ncbi:MAG: hypothetical protein N2517_04905 [Ignavibacteria bacterium]|nr:hypothetical protein [Ignavibacteria bacterium]
MEQDKVYQLVFENAVNNGCPFICLQGTFGVGKSFLVSKLINDILSEKANTFVFFFDLNDTFQFCNLYKSLRFKTNISELEKLNFEDLQFFSERFVEVLNELEGIDKNLSEFVASSYNFYDYLSLDYLGTNRLKELPKLENTINLIFQKKSDRRVLLDFLDILVETLLIPFVSLAAEKRDSDKSINLYFIFDNYELSAASIDYWIVKHLYRYLSNLSLHNFKAYTVESPEVNIKLSDIFNFQFILTSRNNLTARKILNCEPAEKLAIYTLAPLSKAETFDYSKRFSKEFDLEEVYKYTFGIPFILDLFFGEFDANLNRENENIFFNILYEKIFERVPKILKDSIDFLSLLPKFGEEALRCIPMNLETYGSLFRYLKNESDLAEPIPNTNEFYKIRTHYSIIISMNLKKKEKEKFDLLNQLANDYTIAISPIELLTTYERKIIRNIAYFNEIDFGEVLETAFNEDYPDVINFVLSHKQLFIEKDGIFTLQPNLRENLIKLNKLLDNVRFEQKTEFLNSIVVDFKEKTEKLLEESQLKLVKDQKELDELKTKRQTLEKEVVELQKEILNAENSIIETRSKYLNLSKKFTWIPFVFLALASIGSFVVGNNIMYIFNKILETEALRSLGIVLKLLSFFLIAIFIFLLIDLFASKEKKMALQKISDTLRKEEEEAFRKQSQLAELSNAIKSLTNSIEILTKEVENTSVKIAQYSKKLSISYLDNATK